MEGSRQVGAGSAGLAKLLLSFVGLWRTGAPPLTRLLDAVERGERQAAEELLPLVYEELRRLAAAKMGNEQAAHTLQPTALVHEAWIRLLGPEGAQQSWQGRGHFLSSAAEAMRRGVMTGA